MICFALEVNGIPGSAVLSAILTCVQRKPQNATATPELDVRLGGLDSNSKTDDGTHLTWVNQPVKVGDRIAFEIVESDVSDPPQSQTPTYTEEQLEKMRARSHRHYLKHYKRQQAAAARRIRELEKLIAAEKKRKKARKKG